MHRLEGRSAVKVSLEAGDEPMARARWNWVHEEVKRLVQTVHVMASTRG